MGGGTSPTNLTRCIQKSQADDSQPRSATVFSFLGQSEMTSPKCCQMCYSGHCHIQPYQINLLFFEKIVWRGGGNKRQYFFWLTWPPLPLYSISNMWQKTYAASQFLQPIYVIVCSTWKHNNHNATAQDFKLVIHRFTCIHNQLACIRNTQHMCMIHIIRTYCQIHHLVSIITLGWLLQAIWLTQNANMAESFGLTCLNWVLSRAIIGAHC